VVKTAKMKLTF